MARTRGSVNKRKSNKSRASAPSGCVKVEAHFRNAFGAKCGAPGMSKRTDKPLGENARMHKKNGTRPGRGPRGAAIRGGAARAQASNPALMAKKVARTKTTVAKRKKVKRKGINKRSKEEEARVNEDITRAGAGGAIARNSVPSRSGRQRKLSERLR